MLNEVPTLSNLSHGCNNLVVPSDSFLRYDRALRYRPTKSVSALTCHSRPQRDGLGLDRWLLLGHAVEKRPPVS
jgi:hypothetical protein